METRHQITLYNQVTPQIITNSVVETSFFNDTNAIGSRNIAEWFDAIGKTIRVIKCTRRNDAQDTYASEFA
jgi:hypothetical protein